MKDGKEIKVIVGLSGGVDSAVSVIRLQQQGYTVEGCFMRNWDSALNNDLLGNPTINDEVCPQEKDYQDAVDVAATLGIKLHRIDFIEEYWNYVFEYFLSEYRHNRTPNPDILCNKEIKFKAFLREAEKLGADFIAMGHYARVIHDEKNNRHYLLRGVDKNKDQSYFLSQLSQSQLAHALFPVGDIEKPEVRKIAEEYNLSIAHKKDSTGVCFIGERNFKEFLMNYIPANPGKIIDIKGNVVGKHDGVMYYTIGQRKGLGIGGPGDAWFVCGKDALRNELIVAQGDQTELLYGNKVIVKGINMINEPFPSGTKLTVKFRYRQEDVPVTVEWIEGTNYTQAIVHTIEPTKAITPGQACVFYDGEYCLGGGTIDEVYMNDVKRKY